MNECRIHIFSKREDQAWVDTVGALHGVFFDDRARVFLDFGEFIKVSRDVSGPLVLILAPRDAEELDSLWRMREYFWNRDVFLLLPGRDVSAELSADFRPRVILSDPVDVETVTETVSRMVDRETGRYRLWQETTGRVQ